MRRLIERLVLCLALCFSLTAVSALPAPAHADNLTWVMKNGSSSKALVKFYSETRKTVEWPAKGHAWNLFDRAVHKFDLNCQKGEKICYGAVAVNDKKRFWGVGADNKHACKGCCAVCGGKPAAHELR